MLMQCPPVKKMVALLGTAETTTGQNLPSRLPVCKRLKATSGADTTFLWERQPSNIRTPWLHFPVHFPAGQMATSLLQLHRTTIHRRTFLSPKLPQEMMEHYLLCLPLRRPTQTLQVENLEWIMSGWMEICSLKFPKNKCPVMGKLPTLVGHSVTHLTTKIPQQMCWDNTSTALVFWNAPTVTSLPDHCIPRKNQWENNPEHPKTNSALCTVMNW